MNNPLFWLMAINLIAFVVGLLIFARPGWKAAYFKAPRLVQQSLVFFIVAPTLITPFLPQPRIELLPPLAAGIAGGVIVVIAAAIWIMAMARIGVVPSVRESSGLISTGIYGVVRNPLYLGNLLSALGIALALRAWYALIYGLALLILYPVLIVIEEQGLRQDYGGEYTTYQQKVRYRLLPGLW